MNSARIAWLSVSMPRSISVPTRTNAGNQRRRHHGEAETQRRRQCLAERAAIDHPTGAIEGRERRQRVAAPAEFRIAVVLQDPGIRAARPVEQRQASADRQRATQRRGMRWRDQHQAGVRRALDARGDIQTLGVAEYRHRRGAGGEQRTAAGDVAGILHPGGVARIQQQFRGDAQRLLRAGGHHDVARDRPAVRASRRDARRSGCAVQPVPAAEDSR